MNKAIIQVVICSCLILAAACGQEEEEPTSATPEIQATGTIVAMGDSLTEGLGVSEENTYPVLLQKALRDKGYDYRVVNAGISGETSSGARSRMEWVLRLKPDIIILETGANDGLRGLDPELIRRNIREMVDAFTAKGIVVVLAGMKMFPNLGPAYSKMFADVFTDVGSDNDVILIPFFLEGVAGVPKMNQSDGIHPTADGYARVVEHILPYVTEAIARHQKQTR
ncbi:MAG: arylesterase [Desulfobacterales bacterium]|jgi:acyl-CoA thioesterase-1